MTRIEYSISSFTSTVALSSSFRKILDKPAADRSLSDLHSIDEYLMRIRTFAQLPDEARFDLAKSIGFRVYGLHETILREGEVGTDYYIIRTGSVSVSVLVRLILSNQPTRKWR